MEKKFTKGNWGFGENYTSNNGTHVVYSTNKSYPTQNTYIATTLSAFNSEADAKLMAAAPNMLDALLETDKDLCVLESTMTQIELTDQRAQGMTDLVRKWRERNQLAIKKATE